MGVEGAKPLAFLLLALTIAPAARAADARVTIDNFAFTPAAISIHPGDRVVWTNRDDMVHEIADAKDPAALHSQPLDTGDTYARVFAKPGVYPYFCSLHPRMQGTVTVQ